MMRDDDARFSAIFWSDLAFHQDDANTGHEVVDSVAEVVMWYRDNDPDDNVTDDPAGFLAWLRTNRTALATAVDERLFEDEDDW